MNFDEKICLLKRDAASQEETLKLLANEFYKADVVNEGFMNGILEREVLYPTGLLLADGSGVAIPHTDGDKVKRSQIGFLSLNKPVKFYEMGQTQHEIEVDKIFMLALKEAHEQLETLQNLMNLFMNEELVHRLDLCTAEEQYLEIIKDSGLE